MVTATLLLMPTYILSNSKESFLENELSLFDKENPELPLDYLQVVISEINTNLDLLDDEEVEDEMSQNIMNKFLSIKKDKISISRIFFIDKKGDTKATLEVSGVALDRTALNKFKTDLERSELYESVDLPISNFVKPKDINFNIKLQLK